jgi:hypothetical protein
VLTVPYSPALGRSAACLLLGLPFTTGIAAAPVRPNEIIVSAANYAEAPRDLLVKLFHHPVDLIDAPPPPPTTHAVRYYQFLRSEPLDADLSYEDTCKLLVPVLAAKNLVNTAERAKVELILRVTFGGRRWRDPVVRESDLAWRHGLVPKRRSTSLSAAEAWDERAGGDEMALYRLERDLGAEGMADSMIGGLYTEDYFLIVVDAFDVATLRQKGNDTPRAWSTFIAVPRQKGAKFSDVAARMITKAAPYFGETLPGKARFTDREGTVEIRDLKVIEEKKDTAVPKK